MLFAAIAFEVLGTMLLPASQNFSKLLPTTILLISYGISFPTSIDPKYFNVEVVTKYTSPTDWINACAGPNFLWFIFLSFSTTISKTTTCNYLCILGWAGCFFSSIAKRYFL